MCGITAYIGAEPALPFLMQGLSKLEYRGYDSAGVTLVDGSGLFTCKTKGRLKQLEDMLETVPCPQKCGIGHTRWATHGVPSQMNSHPHTNEKNTISLVHNGIIENYLALKEELLKKGYKFKSETDTEIVVHLLDDYYYHEHLSLFQALLKAVHQLQGSFALCIVSTEEPDVIYAAKKESPMVLGRDKCGTMCASDAPALLAYTNEILPLKDGQAVIMKADSLQVFDFDGVPQEEEWIVFPYDVHAAQKGGYDSFMMKEIQEQPSAVRETLRGRFRGEMVYMPEIEKLGLPARNIQRIYYVACGTAYHACVYAVTQISARARCAVSAMPASEFRYGSPYLDEHTLCVFVSQSGETADTIAALKLAKEKGAVTAGIVNVLGSGITRLADATLYTCAGPEISVASTKAYTTQLVLLTCLNIKLADLLDWGVFDQYQLIEDLQKLPEAIEDVLKYEKKIAELAELLRYRQDAYFIGRQLDYPTAMEGALKLKEVSYVHADAYYAGELKHGPIALIEKDSVVIAMATQPKVAAKTVSNIEETIARGARVILITTQQMKADRFEHVLRLPELSDELSAVTGVVLLQMLAYYTASIKGCDIDKPRNLAKSVTVE